MTKKDDAQKANTAFAERSKKINAQWKQFATTYGREAYQDYIDYAESQREMFRQYAEDKAMPHPLKPGEIIPLDNETVAALLQNSRGVNIMRTYITNRVNVGDVAQPKSK